MATPASTTQALQMVLDGLGYLAAADPAALAADAQAECLQVLEQADAICTAARAWILAAFRVETTFAGAGVITGDLTAECAAVVTAVLESLSAPTGAEDTRTREQRYHDGLAGTKGLRDGPFGPDRHAGPIMH